LIKENAPGRGDRNCDNSGYKKKDLKFFLYLSNQKGANNTTVNIANKPKKTILNLS